MVINISLPGEKYFSSGREFDMPYICPMTDAVSVGSYSFNNDGCMPTVGAATPVLDPESDGFGARSGFLFAYLNLL